MIAEGDESVSCAGHADHMEKQVGRRLASKVRNEPFVFSAWLRRSKEDSIMDTLSQSVVVESSACETGGLPKSSMSNTSMSLEPRRMEECEAILWQSRVSRPSSKTSRSLHEKVSRLSLCRYAAIFSSVSLGSTWSGESLPSRACKAIARARAVPSSAITIVASAPRALATRRRRELGEVGLDVEVGVSAGRRAEVEGGEGHEGGAGGWGGWGTTGG